MDNTKEGFRATLALTLVATLFIAFYAWYISYNPQATVHNPISVPTALALALILILVFPHGQHRARLLAVGLLAIETSVLMLIQLSQFIGTRNFKADIWCAGAAWIVGICGTKAGRSLTVSLVKWNANYLPSWWLALRAFLVTSLIFWCLVSAADVWNRGDPLPANLAKFASPPVRNQLLPPPANIGRLGLCLSGGGYRAALLHVGVLSALEELGRRPACISSVSGGSIIAAYYVKGGNPDDFLKAVSDSRFRLAREMFDIQNAVWELPLLGGEGRRAVQANMLEKILFPDMNAIGYRAREWDKAPQLMLCTTDVAMGYMLGLTDSGIVVHPLLPTPWRHEFYNYPKSFSEQSAFRKYGGGWDGFKFADFVAASGAFPAAFGALRVRDLRLGDGGISDNLGLTLMLEARRMAHENQEGSNDGEKKNKVPPSDVRDLAQARIPDAFGDTATIPPEWDVDSIIVSDGGAMFFQDTSSGDQGIAGNLGRAIDIMYANADAVGDRTLTKNPKVIMLSPARLFKGKISKWVDKKYTWQSESWENEWAFPKQFNEVYGQLFPSRLVELNGEGSFRVIRGRISYCMRAFTSTDTLDDYIPLQRAAAIVELGKWLVFLNAEAIDDPNWKPLTTQGVSN